MLQLIPVYILLIFALLPAGSPFKVPVKDVVDPYKVKVAGPGLGTAVRAKIPQSFTVDTSKAGIAPLEVMVTGPRGKMFIDFKKLARTYSLLFGAK